MQPSPLATWCSFRCLPQVGQHHLPLGSGHRSGASPLALGLRKRQGGLLLLFAGLCAWLKGVQQGAAIAQPFGGIVAFQPVGVYHRLPVTSIESRLGHGAGYSHDAMD